MAGLFNRRRARRSYRITAMWLGDEAQDGLDWNCSVIYNNSRKVAISRHRSRREALRAGKRAAKQHHRALRAHKMKSVVWAPKTKRSRE